MYKIDKLSLGELRTNCYIISDESNNCIIIDPGSEYPKIKKLLHDKKPLAILLTHGHYDHIGAVDELYNDYQLPVYLHKEDEEIVRTANNSAFKKGISLKCPVNYFDFNKIQINDFEFKIYHKPGHSPGCVMYEIEGYLFSGDVLFKESIGRYDLYGSSAKDMMKSLRIFPNLNPDLIVLPGHGENTRIADELISNPFLNGLINKL